MSNIANLPLKSHTTFTDVARDHQDVKRETVKARYVVGCDGAHSWVRRQLQIPLEGDHTNKHFGVMDIIPLTDFRA